MLQFSSEQLFKEHRRIVSTAELFPNVFNKEAELKNCVKFRGEQLRHEFFEDTLMQI